MNRKSNAWIQGVLVASGVIGAMVFFGLGPLDPPAGPVMETSPSLAGLDAKLDQVIAQQGSIASISGPWEVFRVPDVGALSDNTSSTLVAEGRVYVHSATAYFTQATIFDGQGSIAPDGNTSLTPNWIARLSHEWSVASGSGRGQIASATVPIEQIVENGLHVAWRARPGGGASYLYVLYKRVPE